jgi:hypothetical protein
MADEIRDAILSNAQGPKSVSGDGGSVQAHDLGEQIEADRYLSERTAVGTTRRGLRFSKMVPPGAD